MTKLPVSDKVAAGGTAGLILTVVVGVLSLLGVTLAPPVAAGITLVVMFGVSWLKTETKLGPQVDAAANAAAVVLANMETEGPVR